MKTLTHHNSYLKSHRGFILPLTLIITTIIVTVSVGISILILKQILFSSLSRQTKVAYYAADDGVACATYVDDAYINQSTGLGIMPYSSSTSLSDTLASVNDYRTNRAIANITLNDIKCGTTAILTSAANFTTLTPDYAYVKSDATIEYGKTSTFNMSMDLGDGTFRCASVIVNKTPTFRQIISRGYSSCTSGGNRIERAIVSQTELQ